MEHEGHKCAVRRLIDLDVVGRLYLTVVCAGVVGVGNGFFWFFFFLLVPRRIYQLDVIIIIIIICELYRVLLKSSRTPLRTPIT